MICDGWRLLGLLVPVPQLAGDAGLNTMQVSRFEQVSSWFGMFRVCASPAPTQPLYLLLQVLRQRHAPLFSLLGKTSGRNVDKLHAIREEGHELVDCFGFPTFAGGAARDPVKQNTDCFVAPACFSLVPCPSSHDLYLSHVSC